MKKILFIDQDQEIRDLIMDNTRLEQEKELSIRICSSLVEAEKVFNSEVFDAIIVDAIRPSSNNILPFIQKIRIKNPELPIVAMLGFLDIKIDERLKASMRGEGVKIVDKFEVLQASERTLALFKTVCDKGDKEIL